MSPRFDTDALMGVDPYDALRGTRIPQFVRSSPRLRQATIQIRKRFPVDLAPLLGVRPFMMAKTAACFLSAHSRGHVVEPSEDDGTAAQMIVDALDRCEGNVGAGAWGYEFDVQTRWAFYAQGTANLIATVFVGRAFLEAGMTFGRNDWLARGVGCAEYLRSRQIKTGSKGRFFAYTPDSTALVHNANLLGCALCAMAGRLGGEPDLIESARECMLASLSSQRTDGSWPYGEGDGLGWSDNFHTAYNLDALLGLVLVISDEGVRDALLRGVADWQSKFFRQDGSALYYRDGSGPIDIHSAATAVDTSARMSAFGFEILPLAERVSAWTERMLVDPASGHTRYRRNRWFTDTRHFVRWGDAHWALATASLACARAGVKPPLEMALVGIGGGR